MNGVLTAAHDSGGLGEAAGSFQGARQFERMLNPALMHRSLATSQGRVSCLLLDKFEREAAQQVSCRLPC